MVFPNNNYNIMNNHRNIYFYDERGREASKTNAETVIYQCDKLQSIDKFIFNTIDAFNPNLICYIPERKWNNNHKYDRLEYFLKED